MLTKWISSLLFVCLLCEVSFSFSLQNSSIAQAQFFETSSKSNSNPTSTPPPSSGGGFAGGASTEASCPAKYEPKDELDSIDPSAIDSDADKILQDSTKTDTTDTPDTEDAIKSTIPESEIPPITTFSAPVWLTAFNRLFQANAAPVNQGQLGTLEVYIQINEVTAQRTAGKDFGPFKPPFNNGAYVTVRGPIPFPNGSPYYGTPILNVHYTDRRIYLNSNGKASALLPIGQWAIINSYYKGVDQGHNYLTERSRKIISDVPRFDVVPGQVTTARLQGLNGAKTNPTRGHLKVRVVAAPPEGVKGPTKFVGRGIAVTIKSTRAPLISKLAYTGPDSIARFYNLDPSRGWVVSKVSYQGSNRFKSEFNPLPISPSDISATLVTVTRELPNPPKPVPFDKNEYKYITEDRLRITKAINDSDLDCQTKVDVLKKLEKIKWFSEYAFENKRKALVNAIKDDAVLKVILTAEANAVDYDAYFLSNKPTHVGKEQNYKVVITADDIARFKHDLSTPLSEKPALDTQKIKFDWPVISSAENRISFDLKGALLTHSTAAKSTNGNVAVDREEYNFAPFASELARAQYIDYLFEQIPSYVKPPKDINPTRFIGKWQDKKWLKKNYPEYVSWFYTFWFANEGMGLGDKSNYKNDTWSADEMMALKLFFSMYTNGSTALKSSISPPEMIVTMAGSAGAAVTIEDVPLTLGGQTIAKLFGRPLAQAMVSQGEKLGAETVEQIGQKWLESIEREATKKIVNDLANQGLKALPGKLRALVQGMSKNDQKKFLANYIKEQSSSLVNEVKNDTGQQIRPTLEREFGKEKAQQIIDQLGTEVEKRVGKMAQKYEKDSPIGVLTNLPTKVKRLKAATSKLKVQKPTQPVIDSPKQIAHDLATAEQTLDRLNKLIEQQKKLKDDLATQVTKRPEDAQLAFRAKAAEEKLAIQTASRDNLASKLPGLKVQAKAHPYTPPTPFKQKADGVIQGIKDSLINRFKRQPDFQADGVIKDVLDGYKSYLEIQTRNATTYIRDLTQTNIIIKNKKTWDAYIREEFAAGKLTIEQRNTLLNHHEEAVKLLGGDTRAPLEGILKDDNGIIPDATLDELLGGTKDPFKDILKDAEKGSLPPILTDKEAEELKQLNKEIPEHPTNNPTLENRGTDGKLLNAPKDTSSPIRLAFTSEAESILSEEQQALLQQRTDAVTSLFQKKYKITDEHLSQINFEIVKNFADGRAGECQLGICFTEDGIKTVTIRISAEKFIENPSNIDALLAHELQHTQASAVNITANNPDKLASYTLLNGQINIYRDYEGATEFLGNDLLRSSGSPPERSYYPDLTEAYNQLINIASNFEPRGQAVGALDRAYTQGKLDDFYNHLVNITRNSPNTRSQIYSLLTKAQFAGAKYFK